MKKSKKRNNRKITKYYYTKNNLGSIDGITSETGETLIKYDYDVYGNTYIINNSGSLTDINEYEGELYNNSRLYTSREYDQEIGLYYNRARYYDPKQGRFINRDPIDISDDVNLYAYVGNNPVMYVDLMGLEKMLIILGIDKDGEDPIFDKNGLITNYEDSYIRTIYNNIKNAKNPKFDVEIVNTFEEFDNAMNEKQREEIIFIGHGNPKSISIDSNNSFWHPFTDKYVINKENLENDEQTKEQKERLKNTSLTLLSCNTGKGDNSIGEQIQNHYGFKETNAPTKTIWDNGEIYDKVNKYGPWGILPLSPFNSKIQINGVFNQFN